jgi:dihydroxy-acid dehydratase
VPISRPRIGVPFFEPSGVPDAVHDAGGEPLPLRLQPSVPEGGIVLAREWVADLAEISCSGMDLDGLLLDAASAEELAGMLIAGLRLNLPTVCAPTASTPLSAAFVALGLAPAIGRPANTAVSLVGSKGPCPRGLVDDFSLANALRVGVAAGGGPEVLVHLAAIARETGVAGFGQMMRVLAAETPQAGPEWLRKHGVTGLLSSLGDALRDVPTVAGNLKKNLPSAPPAPEEHARLVFVKARASGADAVCHVREGMAEAAGECRVFDSEKAAISSVRRGEVGEGTMLVVGGCGPRGGPGLLRLDTLGRYLKEAGIEVPVLTDGLAPEGAEEAWISLFTPEGAAGGVISLLRDGDTLRIDLVEGRIRTGAGDFTSREPGAISNSAGTAYAARYSQNALPALDGAGFS